MSTSICIYVYIFIYKYVYVYIFIYLFIIYMRDYHAETIRNYRPKAVSFDEGQLDEEGETYLLSWSLLRHSSGRVLPLP